MGLRHGIGWLSMDKVLIPLRILTHDLGIVNPLSMNTSGPRSVAGQTHRPTPNRGWVWAVQT